MDFQAARGLIREVLLVDGVAAEMDGVVRALIGAAPARGSADRVGERGGGVGLRRGEGRRGVSPLLLAGEIEQRWHRRYSWPVSVGSGGGNDRSVGRNQVGVVGVSTLVVPVLAAQSMVEATNARRHRAGRRVLCPVWSPRSMPPHVTLLYPFVPGPDLNVSVESELCALFGAMPTFAFSLASVGRFPKIIYAAPEPADPFIVLINTLMVQWPSYQPYGGTFDSIVPHMTVLHGRASRRVVRRIARSLPIEALATEVWLMVENDWEWSLRRRFKLLDASEHLEHPALHTGEGTK